jgi:hypothetical protein
VFSPLGRIPYFFRLAFFFGFDGLISATLRIMASNADGSFCGFVFNP